MPNRHADPNHLTPERDGRFCKRVRGVLHHFGANGDRDSALSEWLAVKDDLLAGRPVRRVPVDDPGGTATVKFVNDSFLTDCTAKVDAGRMRGGTFDDYYRACEEFGRSVGWGTDPDQLTPDDFRDVRRQWAKRMGPWSLDRCVQAVRTMFNFAVTHRLIGRQPFYGDAFPKSTEAEKRGAARVRTKARGERVFSADELAVILAAAIGPLRAMILLALNGGMYARDISALEVGDVRQVGGVWLIDFARGKTGGIAWKFPLWPETKAALDQVIAHKAAARNSADGNLIFLTCHGRRWVREHTRRDGAKITASASVDAVAQEFDKLLAGAYILADKAAWKWRPLKRDGLGFGTFRHTFITAIGDVADVHARHLITGHKVGGVQGRHYDKVPVHRLKSVTDLARERLLLKA